MDLLATVRKEGSRGGQGDFKWSDVQNSSHREHYLGHSLMAPVGRWAKGRDLNWYAKSTDEGQDNEDAATKAARERKEEIRRIKEAEEDALARALGLPVPDRNNANLEPVSDKREVDKVLRDVRTDDQDEGRGIGFGTTRASGETVLDERLEGAAIETTSTDHIIHNRTDGIIHLIDIITIADTVPDHGNDTETGLETDVDQGLETIIAGKSQALEVPLNGMIGDGVLHDRVLPAEKA